MVTSKNRDSNDVYDFFVIGNSTDDYVKYEINNWFYILYNENFELFENSNCQESLNSRNSRDSLCKINKKNVAVWLSTKGEIEYRLEPYGKIESAPKAKVNLIISTYCQELFKIVEVKFRDKSSENDNKISIYDLLLVEGYKFEPYQKKEFFYKSEETVADGMSIQRRIAVIPLAYINSFKPSLYLQEPFDKKIDLKQSIILQYIYYLADYNKSRFYYILDWIVSFFKNLQNKSSIALVLIGNKTSGKELFFDEIISPLFGEEYCVKITDYNLDFTNHYSLVKNKIFYNLHNLSTVSIDKKRNQSFLKDLVIEDRIYMENIKNENNAIKLYGQTLITSDDGDIKFLDNISSNYTVFKIPDKIDLIFLNEDFKKKKESLTLKELIREDLKNFSYILKAHNINKANLHTKFEQDDKKEMKLSLTDKINSLHKAIISSSIEIFNKISNNEVYQEIKDDFDENKIKQKNIYICFLLLFPEEERISSKTLMTYLRNIDSEFYHKDKLLNGKLGLKYYSIKR